jgi:hypothetical protein
VLIELEDERLLTDVLIELEDERLLTDVLDGLLDESDELDSSSIE